MYLGILQIEINATNRKQVNQEEWTLFMRDTIHQLFPATVQAILFT